jgi:hypothetical protein
MCGFEIESGRLLNANFLAFDKANESLWISYLSRLFQLTGRCSQNSELYLMTSVAESIEFGFDVQSSSRVSIGRERCVRQDFQHVSDFPSYLMPRMTEMRDVLEDVRQVCHRSPNRKRGLAKLFPMRERSCGCSEDLGSVLHVRRLPYTFCRVQLDELIPLEKDLDVYAAVECERRRVRRLGLAIEKFLSPWQVCVDDADKSTDYKHRHGYSLGDGPLLRGARGARLARALSLECGKRDRGYAVAVRSVER